MGRPKGSKNSDKPRKKRAPKTAAGSVFGHNFTAGALTDAERQALHFKHVKEYEQALETKKAADASFKNACKLIKAEGGSVRAVKLTIELKTPEGETAFRQRLAEDREVAQWNGVGVQIDMEFGDREPAVDRAFGEGQRAGMQGEPRKPPYDPSAPQFSAWQDGYTDGNAAMAAAKFKQQTPVEQAAASDDGETDVDPRPEFLKRKHAQPDPA